MSLIKKYYVNTTTKVDILVITEDVKRALRESQAQSGTAVILVPEGVAGLALLESDPKIHEELKNWVEQQIPISEGARPSRRSMTGKNSAHLRAALLGLNLVIPIQDGKLLSSAWQDIVLFDFDDKVGRREIIVQVISEASAPK